MFVPHQDLAEGFVLHVGQVLGQGRGVQMVKQQRGFTFLLNAWGHLPLPLEWWADESNALAKGCYYIINQNKRTKKKLTYAAALIGSLDQV